MLEVSDPLSLPVDLLADEHRNLHHRGQHHRQHYWRDDSAETNVENGEIGQLKVELPIVYDKDRDYVVKAQKRTT